MVEIKCHTDRADKYKNPLRVRLSDIVTSCDIYISNDNKIDVLMKINYIGSNVRKWTNFYIPDKYYDEGVYKIVFSLSDSYVEWEVNKRFKLSNKGNLQMIICSRSPQDFP